MVIKTAALSGEESAPKKRTREAPAKKTTVEVQASLPPNPFIHEILELVSKQKTSPKRVEVLKEYGCDALKAILIWNFDDTVISMIPEGTVPYERNDVPIGTDHTSLRREWRQLYNFVQGGNDSLSAVRRETMFIQILEGLHPAEADILVLVKDKKLGAKYRITQANVEGAYPEITWGGRSR